MSELLLTDTPSLFVDGKEFKMKRLTTKVAFKFINLLQKIDMNKAIALIGEIVKAVSSEEAKSGEDLTPVFLATKLLQNLSEAEQEIRAFIAMVLDITVEEYDELPFTALITFIQLIFKHPDIAVFIDQLQALMTLAATNEKAMPK